MKEVQKGSKKSLGGRVLAFLSSYKLATLLFVLLVITTFFGTIEQKDIGIFYTQKKYFDVWPVVVFPNIIHGKIFPLPVISAYWLCALLFVNLLLGGIIRLRKNWKKGGVFISHLGILFLLVAGFVEHLAKQEGMMGIYEGEKADFAQSYHFESLEICEIKDGRREAPWVISPEELEYAGRKGGLRASFPDLPFDVKVTHYFKNALLEKARNNSFSLRNLELRKESEENRAGCKVEVLEKGGGVLSEVFLWESVRWPQIATFSIEGRTFGFSLVSEIWPMPFEVELHSSEGRNYPGTGNKAEWFQSDIVRVTGEDRRSYSVVMNRPMRYEGYTLYQARWQDTGARAYSGFAVVNNPSDQWPKYALYISGVGLLIHFGMKLFFFLVAQTKRKEAKNEG